MDNIDDVLQAIRIGIFVATFLLNTNRVLKAVDTYKECLIKLNSKALEKAKEFLKKIYTGIYFQMLTGYALINDHSSGIECCSRLLVLLPGCGKRAVEGTVTLAMATFYHRQSKYIKALEFYEKALGIMAEIGNRKEEALCYRNQGAVFYFLGEYVKAEEYLRKALEIKKEIGDIQGEASCYGNLGIVFQSLGEYVKAEEYNRKALVINKEIGDRQGEASCYGNLGTVFTYRGEHIKAEEYLQTALALRTEVGDREGAASDYGNLGNLFQYRGECVKAEKYLQKALAIKSEIGDKQGQATCYGCLGTVFISLGEYVKAEQFVQKGLAMTKEIGDRQGEASCYETLGDVFTSISEYVKAEQYFLISLAIRKEICDRRGEASCYGKLGTAFESLGKYVNAEEYIRKALKIRKGIGDKQGEASDYVNLGVVFQFLAEHVKAEENLNKALAIAVQIDNKVIEASCYGNLGAVFQSIGEHVKAKQYLQKALAIRIETGDRPGVATDYGNLGNVFQSLGEYAKAEEYHHKALEISKEIGDKKGEARDYGNLGTVFWSRSEYVKAKQYHNKALALSKEIGDAEAEFQWHCNLTVDMLSEGNAREALLNLFASIRKCEGMRGFLRDDDQFQISFLDKHVPPYQMLSALLWRIGDFLQSLYVVELGRARALADLMSVQYSVGEQMSGDPQSWVGLDRIMKKESNCTCLYISYFDQHIFLWILKANKPIYSRRIDVSDDSILKKGSLKNLNDFFGKAEPFRRFQNLSQENCEDRSLLDLNPRYQTAQSQEDSLADFRLVEEEDDEDQEPKPSLSLYYKLIIAPLVGLVEEPEIVIAPDRQLYRVPFAALEDESGKYLSETFRIRIVPSLTTLKIIQDRPPDNHSETDALIVGDPDVSQVFFLSQLPCARKEAEMIGELLGVQPLLGHQANKPVVLDMMHSASLIHVAAHGDAERGEIALAPVRPTQRLLRKDDYLLTMSDISEVQLRAKLVVLSCCHSGRGQIRAEGVVEIARAFLGSGARSVLVSLWAIQDKATEQFMSRFYEHLVRGESASESLHQAMKWMRGNGFSDVRQWAPFMLIGDNVTFAFGK